MNICQFHRAVADIDEFLQVFSRKGIEFEVLEIKLKRVVDCAGECANDNRGDGGRRTEGRSGDGSLSEPIRGNA